MKKHLIAAALALGAAFATQAELAVVVSAKTKLGTLGKEQVADIYLGKVSEINGGAVVLADLATAQREEFYTKATGRSLAQVKAGWTKMLFTGKGVPPKEFASAEEVKKFVADNPMAIGYIDKSAVDGSVKALFTLP